MRIRPSGALSALLLALSLGNAPIHAADDASEVRKLLQSGQHERARQLSERLASADPRNAEARFLHGIALAELNRPADAIAVFRKLTEDFPALPEPYNNLAVLHARQRNYDKAREALERAIRTHPSYATAHANLSDLYATLANEAYVRALQMENGTARNTPNPPLALIQELKPAPVTLAAAGPAALPSRASAPAPTLPPTVAPMPVAAPATPALAQASTDKPASPAQPAALPTPQPAPAKPQQPMPQPPAAQPAPATPSASTSGPGTTQPAAPTPASSTPAAPALPTQDESIVAAVQGWAAAWSSKQAPAYLALYDKDFEVPGGGTRAAWERERKQRLDKPGRISVEIGDPQVTINGDKARVRFLQRYRSSNFNSNTMKTLEFVRRGDKWLISREQVGG